MGERRKRNSSDKPIPDRVATAFGIAYGESDPERGLETLRALLGKAQTDDERQALLGYGEVLQMRLIRRSGAA